MLAYGLLVLFLSSVLRVLRTGVGFVRLVPSSLRFEETEPHVHGLPQAVGSSSQLANRITFKRENWWQRLLLLPAAGEGRLRVELTGVPDEGGVRYKTLCRAQLSVGFQTRRPANSLTGGS